MLNIDIPSSSISPTKAPRAFGATSMESIYVISARYLSIVRVGRR
jgi:hypothetical protein